MLTSNLAEQVLIDPIRRGSDKLCIIAGYATHTMASWHIKQIQALNLCPIEINLIVGMCNFDGLVHDVHNGFKELTALASTDDNLSDFTCQYVCEGPPVHSKLYIWSHN